MPELPEVETTVRAISAIITGLTLKKIIIRNHNLRWPISKEFEKIKNVKIIAVKRRAKYILLDTNKSSIKIMIHLGMSGHLTVLNTKSPHKKHDHVDFIFNNNIILRYTDPRRFGSIHLITENFEQHSLLAHLGPEPFLKQFNADYLYKMTRNKKISVKQCIMNHKVVVGVGNIYASEALFLAKISPLRLAHSLTKSECKKLVVAIQKILKGAIKQGGTTLRDFLSPEGKPGYFKQKLLVYGRENEPCVNCGNPVVRETLNQRSVFYCSQCQK